MATRVWPVAVCSAIARPAAATLNRVTPWGLGSRNQAVAQRAGQQNGANDALEASLLRPGTIARNVEAAEILKLLAPMGASAIERTAGKELFLPQRVVAMVKVDIGEFGIMPGM
jgi:hypothetical protein